MRRFFLGAMLSLISLAVGFWWGRERSVPLVVPPPPTAIGEETGEKMQLQPVGFREALLGDVAAAETIANRYANQEQWDAAKYWFQIAAENGSLESMNRLSIVLAKTDALRSKFWRDRFAAEQLRKTADVEAQSRTIGGRGP